MAWCQGQTGLRIPAARPSTAESLRVKQHIGLPLNSRHLGDSAAAQTGRAKQNLLAATTIAPGIAKRPTSCILDRRRNQNNIGTTGEPKKLAEIKDDAKIPRNQKFGRPLSHVVEGRDSENKENKAGEKKAAIWPISFVQA